MHKQRWTLIIIRNDFLTLYDFGIDQNVTDLKLLNKSKYLISGNIISK
jgi:hypothetical protein